MKTWFLVAAMALSACAKKADPDAIAPVASEKKSVADSAPPAPAIDAEPPRDAAEDAPDAAAVLKKNQWRFRACMNAALATDPTASGKVTLELAIDAKGVVTKSSVASTTAPPALTKCIAKAGEELVFTPTGTTTTILVPIVLVTAK